VSAPTAGERAGSVALLGWTNVGKSTLLNCLVGTKLAAVSAVPQTTRARVAGVCHLPGQGQLVLLDLPGLHEPRSRLNRAMVDAARSALGAADAVALVVDAARGLGPGDRRVAEWFRRANLPGLAVLNKIDSVVPKSRLLPLMRVLVEEWGIPEALPVSARTGEGCPQLARRLIQLLPVGPPLFDSDAWTDQSERRIVEEWIRESLVQVTRQELPHATAVLVEHWTEREDGLVEIAATVLVERESQKAIVIGGGGARLKAVGRQARIEIERLLGRRVFLALHVRAHADWRNDERVLRALGLV